MIWILLYVYQINHYLYLSFTLTHTHTYTFCIISDTRYLCICVINRNTPCQLLPQAQKGKDGIAFSYFLFWEIILISPVCHQQSTKKKNRPSRWAKARCPRSGQCYSRHLAAGLKLQLYLTASSYGPLSLFPFHISLFLHIQSSFVSFLSVRCDCFFGTPLLVLLLTSSSTQPLLL